MTVTSPSGVVELRFRVADGKPQYSIKKSGSEVLTWSGMGFELDGGIHLNEEMTLATVDRDELDETWTPVWGARRRYAVTARAWWRTCGPRQSPAGS